MSGKKIVICMGSSCYTRGNARNVELAEKFLEEHGLNENAELEVDVCGGLCTENCLNGPIVLIDGTVYKHVDEGLLLDLLNANISSAKNKEAAR